MAVTARPASSLTHAATIHHAGPHALQPVHAGTYSVEVGDEAGMAWHSHDLHQLEYALEGVAQVTTDTARFLLPPQQAVWIPAGVEHCSTLTNVKAVSVFFDPAMGLPAGDRVRILAAAPLIREMIRYAQRWPIGRTASDPMADAFFDALAYLVVEWLDHETPLCLPTTRDPLVAAAMDYTSEHLADATLHDLCATVGTSERTLRRAFVAATGMSWRQYLQESRLMKAMALLAEDDQSVLSIALAVGFDSVSAFTRAFGRYAGETPTAYRRRIRDSNISTSPTTIGSQSTTTVRQWSHWGDDIGHSEAGTGSSQSA